MIMEWIQSNFETLFSGFGVYIIGLIVSAICFILFKKMGNSNKVSQRDIKTSGGDVVGRDKKG